MMVTLEEEENEDTNQMKSRYVAKSKEEKDNILAGMHSIATKKATKFAVNLFKGRNN